jgi:hypothetical protein
MGRSRGWGAAATGGHRCGRRGGRRWLAREHRQVFWQEIARGAASEDAGIAVGVSPAVGSR